MLNIKQCTFIRGLYWTEPLVFKLIEERGEYIHIVGDSKTSSEHIDKPIKRNSNCLPYSKEKAE